MYLLFLWVVYSLEEKLSRLENENHVLRQNTLSLSPKRIGQRVGEVCKLWLFSAALFEYACTKVCTLWNCCISYLLGPCIPPSLLVNLLSSCFLWSILFTNSLLPSPQQKHFNAIVPAQNDRRSVFVSNYSFSSFVLWPLFFYYLVCKCLKMRTLPMPLICTGHTHTIEAHYANFT